MCCVKCIKKLFGHARSDSLSGILLELGLPTATLMCIILVFCLQVIARCHTIRSLSGLLTLLYCNFFFMVLFSILACLVWRLLFLWTEINVDGWIPMIRFTVNQGQISRFQSIAHGWFHIRLLLTHHRICHRFRNI